MILFIIIDNYIKIKIFIKNFIQIPNLFTYDILFFCDYFNFE